MVTAASSLPLEAAAGSALQWVAFPHVLVRLPAIPRSRLPACRYERALALHAEARFEAVQVRETARALAERIGKTLPLATERQDRRDLLAARRALFNLAPLPNTTWASVAVTLDADLKPAISDFLTAKHALDDLLRRQDQQFDRDAEDGDAALLALTMSAPFRMGLSLANPLLARRMERIAGERRPTRSKPERQAISRAARYVWRAAMRPTPFGFFASTAIGTLTSAHPGLLATLSRRLPQVRANRQILTTLTDLLKQHPAMRKRLRLRPAATCFFDGDNWWAPDGVDGQWQPGADVSGSAHEFLKQPERASQWRDLEEKGVPQEEIEDLLRRGMLELDFGEPWGELDGFDVIARPLWEEAMHDPTLLTWVGCLEEYRDSLQRWERSIKQDGLVVAQSETPALPLMGRDAGNPTAAYVDTYCPDTLPALEPGMASFFREVAKFAAGYLYPGLMPEEQTLRAIFDRFSPDGAPLPLLQFHRDYQILCQRHGLGSDHWQNSYRLSQLLGLPWMEPSDVFAAELDGLLVANEAELAYQPDRRLLGDWESARKMRLAFRFMRAADGPLGARFHPTFWGSDRMSLFPRYARLPAENSQELERDFQAWMGEWPRTADIYWTERDVDARPLFTPRAINAPGSPFLAQNIAPRDLIVMPTGHGGRLMVVDKTTEQPLTPVWFGVSTPGTLPPIVQFLLHFGGMQTSLIEMLHRAVNRLIATRSQTCDGKILSLPGVSLGNRILLSPRTFVIPGAALPRLHTPVDRADFFLFHDWLHKALLPERLVQVRRGVDGRPPLWVDFGHPEGLNNFLRYVAGAQTILLLPPLLPSDHEGLAATEGSFEAEFYVELAAGTEVTGSGLARTMGE